MWEVEKAKEAQAKSAHPSSTLPNSYRLKKSLSKQLKTPTLRIKPYFILRAGGIIRGISLGCYEHDPWQPFFIGN